MLSYGAAAAGAAASSDKSRTMQRDVVRPAYGGSGAGAGFPAPGSRTGEEGGVEEWGHRWHPPSDDTSATAARGVSSSSNSSSSQFAAGHAMPPPPARGSGTLSGRGAGGAGQDGRWEGHPATASMPGSTHLRASAPGSGGFRLAFSAAGAQEADLRGTHAFPSPAPLTMEHHTGMPTGSAPAAAITALQRSRQQPLTASPGIVTAAAAGATAAATHAPRTSSGGPGSASTPAAAPPRSMLALLSGPSTKKLRPLTGPADF